MNKKPPSTHEEIVIAAGRHYVCQFRQQLRGGYLVTSPQFLPLAAYGETIDAARAKARERIEAWIEYADARELA
jgi:predicted RNase H-like HicB family nuclease